MDLIKLPRRRPPKEAFCCENCGLCFINIFCAVNARIDGCPGCGSKAIRTVIKDDKNERGGE